MGALYLLVEQTDDWVQAPLVPELWWKDYQSKNDETISVRFEKPLKDCKGLRYDLRFEMLFGHLPTASTIHIKTRIRYSTSHRMRDRDNSCDQFSSCSNFLGSWEKKKTPSSSIKFNRCTQVSSIMQGTTIDSF